MPLPPMTTADGRRFWAFVVILGGCFIFTVFAAVGVWLVSGNALYSLYLALAAHLQLFVGMGAFSFVLGRRMRGKAGKDGFEFDDSGDDDAKAETLAAAGNALTDKATEIKEGGG